MIQKSTENDILTTTFDGFLIIIIGLVAIILSPMLIPCYLVGRISQKICPNILPKDRTLWWI